jgi:NAD/NADP transhydrogenase alpha subunit
MATRRRSRAHAAARPPSLSKRVYRAATSPAAKAAYVAAGSVGLAALAIAIFGPRRFQRVVVQPVRSAVSDQAERLWNDAQPLRNQLGGLIERTTNEAGREKLVRSFQSWIGHFRAT